MRILKLQTMNCWCKYFILISFLSISTLFAQTELPNEQELIVDEKNSFSYTAQSLEATVTEGKERIVLEDQALIQSKDTTISAQNITIYGKGYRFVVAHGDVRIYDQKQQISIHSQTALFDRETEIAKIIGYSSLEDEQNELILKANYLENDSQRNTFKAQIGVRLLKEDLVARCDYASYNRDSKIFTLSGGPSLYYQGDEYEADVISINTETDKIQLQGSILGRVFVEDEDE